ncbi:14389_t:CDS:1, partial [Entrophospora sp. SA101]
DFSNKVKINIMTRLQEIKHHEFPKKVLMNVISGKEIVELLKEMEYRQACRKALNDKERDQEIAL